MSTHQAFSEYHLKKPLNVLYRIALRTLTTICFYKLFSRDPGIRERFLGLPPYSEQSLCVFAGFSRSPEVPRYVLFHIGALKAEGFDIIFVTTNQGLSPSSIEQLKSLCIMTVHRRNVGLDFGSWKAGLMYSGVEWQKYRKILFANDSYYAPLFSLKEVMQHENHGIVSITDSLEQEPHLMSYFLLCHEDVIRHVDFLKFWQDVRMVPNRLKGLIVQLYEIGFSRYFRKRGFHLKAAYRIAEIGHELGLTETDLRKINPTHRFWRHLIEIKKCPILKVDLFKRFFIPKSDESWRNAIANTEYDERLIQEHQNLSKTGQ